MATTEQQNLLQYLLFRKQILNYNLYMHVYIPGICFPGLGLAVELYKVYFQVLFSLIRALISIMK